MKVPKKLDVISLWFQWLDTRNEWYQLEDISQPNVVNGRLE